MTSDQSPTKAKTQFAAIPTAAIGDTRLHAADWRVLAVIARYDRFTNNGRGCFVRQERMAKETGLQKRQLTRSLRRLEDFGYIRRERAAENRRRRTYFVKYNDNPVMGDTDVTYQADGAEDGAFDDRKGDTGVPFQPTKGDMESEQPAETVGVHLDKRFCKTDFNKFSKTGGFVAEFDSLESKRDSAQAHGIQGNSDESDDQALELRQHALTAIEEGIQRLRPRDHNRILAMKGKYRRICFDKAVDAELEQPGAGARVLRILSVVAS